MTKQAESPPGGGRPSSSAAFFFGPAITAGLASSHAVS